MRWRYCNICAEVKPHIFGKCIITVVWYLVFAVVGLLVGFLARLLI